MRYGKPHILNGRGEYVPFNLNCYSSLMTARAGEHQEEARAVKLAEKHEKIAEKIAEKEEETAERQQQKEADKEGGSILEELSKIAKKLRGNSSKEYYSASYPSVKRSK
jgi:uncharacterized protein YdcH (DUF465 family)